MQELQARQREYQKTLHVWEEILRFWKDFAERNGGHYERRPLDLGLDYCPIYSQCKRSQSFTPVIDEQFCVGLKVRCPRPRISEMSLRY